ncbi:peptide chain release factor N(5)-glutamine methyltransferase [Paraflavisolibacter sp. H34]|uniref:peptide chain release factor N(5)-glutamine methyltransferase n=1 Tax=Huijunlia imazamoxiresistens TaxID=3127457 RepID=UPI0030164E43
MKTGQAEIWLRQEISSIYDSREAANIAALVMEQVTGLSRVDRLSRRDDPLVVQQLHHLTECHHRLLHHEPVQYVLNEAWFYGMKLFVDRNVLIPRPETEELVDWIVSDLKASGKDVFDRQPAEADETTRLKILDVGTGSGCIALALKKAMPKAETWACDFSDDALAVARRNGSELDIRVDFVGLDFLDEAQRRQLPTVDILVSNPPYIPLGDKEEMQPNVLDFEPHSALFVPDSDVLLFYRALAQFGKHRLHPGGCLYAEIHEGLGPEVVALFENEGYLDIELRTDMQGKHRMVKAVAPA